jgi:hypothetical protein
MSKAAVRELSQRAYAKELGLSHNAVSKAIKEGKLVKGWDKEKQKIILPAADLEWGHLHREVDTSEVLSDGGDSGLGEMGRTLTLKADTPFGEARRIREIITAKLASLDLDERKGELVKRTEVQSQLFAYGQQMRKAMEQLPVRIVDSVRAATERDEAVRLAEDAISDVLRQLTSIEEKALEPA